MAIGAGLVIGRPAAAQIRYATGQNVVAVFEGWEHNPDGSFNMVFGYMNRNYEEEVDVPIGPSNMIEPGGPGGPGGPGAIDQGQPTHFYLRRQQFMFKVRVPKDWGKKDLVWTLISAGKAEKAYASLAPFRELGVDVYQQNRGGPVDDEDKPPAITVIGLAKRTVSLSDSVPLEVQVDDDGLPAARPARGGGPEAGRGAEGRGGPPAGITPRVENPLTQMIVKLDPGVRLGVTWVVHRRSGAGTVTFNPAKVAVTDGRAATSARFSAPGTYVLRGYADDGILLDYADVTVTVTAAGR